MPSRQSENPHFSSHFARLKEFCTTVDAMVVFDQSAEAIWQSDDDLFQIDQMKSEVEKFSHSAESNALLKIHDGQSLEIIKLLDQQQETKLTLCIIHPIQSATLAPAASNDKTALLNQLLLSNYQHDLEIASKEQELNLITDELVQRYEELNLIYKSEDQATNSYHGRELLQQLVSNTSRFLNADIVFLYIANQDIELHKFKNDNPLFGSDQFFKYLRESVYPVIEQDQESIVINHDDDMRKFNLDNNTAYKHIVSPMINVNNQVIGLIAIASQNFSIDFSNSDRNLADVMAKKASKVMVSHFDPLTGLENNYSFQLMIDKLLKQRDNTGVQHAIVNLDIDRMAVINDISGREAGDQLIIKVAKTLTGMIRSRDIVAHLGSDKFGILLENCDLPTAKTVMQKISAEIGQIEMSWKQQQHEVSVSIGIAPISQHAESVTGLMNAAETARNVSQEHRRNNIHILDLDDHDLQQRKEQISWVGRIQSALRDDRFILFAQLIQPLTPESGAAHYEILLRMQDEDGSPIPPLQFLPAAESFYLMSSIDLWVIDHTFRALAAYFKESRTHFPVSINLSGQSLSDPAVMTKFIHEKLHQYQLNAEDICFEITESAAIANIEEACVFIDQLQSFGFKFSLDDFGTGLSSFSYLKTLNVDYLKIDGSFVKDIIEDKVSESMVTAINQVGHAMNLKTIAEYVENDAIRERLETLGIDYGQGYGLARPEPLQDIFSARINSTSKSA